MLNKEADGLEGRKVLIIDDDAHTCRMLETIFGRAGAEVHSTVNALEGVRLVGSLLPDLVVLDIMMPEMDGWETMSRIRHYGAVPTIMLSVLSGEEVVIRGLEVGAVDYVTKPFNPAVLVARARAALRLSAVSDRRARPIAYRDERLSINLIDRTVLVGDQPARLTKTEYLLLACLFQNVGQVLSPAQLLERVWGVDHAQSAGAVHTYLSRLRQKLEADPGHPRYLLTEHGMGYRFEADRTRLEFGPGVLPS